MGSFLCVAKTYIFMKEIKCEEVTLKTKISLQEDF